MTTKLERSSARVDVNARSVALTVIAVAAAIALLRWAEAVFIPIVLSVLIGYALSPVVNRLVRWHVPRLLAATLVVGGLLGGLVYSAYSLSDDLAAVVAQVPEAAQKLRQAVPRGSRQDGTIANVQKAAEELQKTADEAAGPAVAPRGVMRVQMEEPAIDLREYLYWGSAGIIAFANQTILVGFFVFFLLLTGDLFKRKVVKLAGPSLERKRVTVQILDEINEQIERFLFVRLVTSIVVAAATWAAFRAIGLEQALVWALMAGLFNTIPYFGPVIVAGATAVIAFVQFGTIGMAAYVAGASLVITSVEGWLVTPWLTSKTTRTNEVAVFVGLIFWSWAWGVWGTLLAVPMLVVTKAFCDRIEDLKPIGELLGE